MTCAVDGCDRQTDVFLCAEHVDVRAPLERRPASPVPVETKSEPRRCHWRVGDRRCPATVPEGSKLPLCVVHGRALMVAARRHRNRVEAAA